jgi:hypothetical protein
MKGSNTGYKNITVKSVTYAQKGKDILARHGIDGYIARREKGDGRSCLWCIKVRSDRAERAIELLKAGGVAMTGEVYETR